MRNIISLAHISLDGFMADPAGRFDFVVFNAELADHTYPLMGSVDLAVYGLPGAGDVLIYPASVVSDRYASRDAAFLVSGHEKIVQQVAELRG